MHPHPLHTTHFIVAFQQTDDYTSDLQAVERQLQLPVYRYLPTQLAEAVSWERNAVFDQIKY